MKQTVATNRVRAISQCSRVRLTCLLAALTSLSCGSDGDGARGSGVDGDLVLSDLQPAQKRAVCRASIERGWANVSFEDECTAEAVEETSTLGECRAFVTECVREYEAEFAEERADALAYCDELGEDALNCEYTVAEYERCDRDVDAAWRREARKRSCTDADVYEEDDDRWYGPAECEAVLRSCYIL